MTTRTVRRSDFRFFHPLRVRWSEVDMQKIVFNGHYLMYLDTAVGDYWRQLALPYEQAMAHLGGDLYVRKAALDYHASARYDDRLDIGMRCERIGRSSIQFQAAVFRGDTLLVGGELIYVYADPATQTSQAVPDALRATLNAFESGESMVVLRSGSWEEMESLVAPLRQEVFVVEQGVAPELEWDTDDGSAVHVAMTNRLGLTIATARLMRHGEHEARVGRMAVARVLRGTGFGRQLMQHLIALARARGDRSIVLHAQCSAEGFYSALGFLPEGEPFDEAGMAHRIMRRDLDTAAPAADQMSSSRG